MLARAGANRTRTSVPTVPAKNDPIAAVASAGPARPRGHLVPVDRGHRGRRLARQVDQDRRRRPAVLGAVVDAGQHDQRRHRLEGEGDRQEHRDRGRRPDPGQDADQRSRGRRRRSTRAGSPGVSAVAKPEREVVEELHRRPTPGSRGRRAAAAGSGRRRRSGRDRTVSPTATSAAADEPSARLARAARRAVRKIDGTRPSPRTVNPKTTSAPMIRTDARHGTSPIASSSPADEPLTTMSAPRPRAARRGRSGK